MPWSYPMVDVSKQRLDALLLDVAALAARFAAASGSSGGAPTHASPAFAAAVRAGLGGTYDSPCEPCDPTKAREPRVLVAGGRQVLRAFAAAAAAAGKPAAAGGAKPALVIADAPAPPATPLARLGVAKGPAAGAAALAPLAGAPADALPPVALSLSLRLLSTVAQWGVAVPLRRCSLHDVGVRPFDPVNAAFTLEAWVRPGWPHAGPAPGTAEWRAACGEDDGGYDDGDDAGSAADGASSAGGGGDDGEDAGGGAPKVVPRFNRLIASRRQLTLFARSELFLRPAAGPGAGSVGAAAAGALTAALEASPAGGVGDVVAARLQWSLALRPRRLARLPRLPQRRRPRGRRRWRCGRGRGRAGSVPRGHAGAGRAMPRGPRH